MISVIMSVYNEKPEYIKLSVESILRQSYKNLEYIIVLDNPENSTLKNCLYRYAEQDQRINVIDM